MLHIEMLSNLTFLGSHFFLPHLLLIVAAPPPPPTTTTAIQKNIILIILSCTMVPNFFSCNFAFLKSDWAFLFLISAVILHGNSSIHIDAVIDPLSSSGQKLAPLLRILWKCVQPSMRIVLNPLVSFSIKSFLLVAFSRGYYCCLQFRYHD